MRKNLTFCLMLMASTLTIGLLAGCSEEVTVNNKNGNDRQLPVVCDSATVFVSGTDATRTKIDNNALFYWVKDDQIWVDENGDNQFLLKSDKSELVDQGRKANFTFNTNLSKPTYNLTYTGNGSTSGTKVTIKKQQFQSQMSNSNHIGTSGDCGVAKAEKVAGKYSFNLQHKAHYLIFQPSKDPFINEKLGVKDVWTLTSIDIVDTDGIPLSGTFSFSMEEGLDQTQEIVNANDSVRLICGDSGFVLPESDETDDAKKVFCYAVIAPAPNGQNRNLKIRYNIQSSKILVNPIRYGNTEANFRWDGDDSLPIVRKISNKFLPNGVSKFNHRLGQKVKDFGDALTFSSNVYYTWDADEEQYFWKGALDDPYPDFGTQYTNPTFYLFNWEERYIPGVYLPYPMRRFDVNDDPRSFNSVLWPEEGDNKWEPYRATRSCQYMPDVNAASWYVMAGDPRWETEKIWCINGNYRHVYTTGVWFLKWDEIPNKPEGSKINECSRSYNGTDYRTTPIPSGSAATPFPFVISDRTDGAYANSISTVNYKKGRPSDSEIHKYFFLPALGTIRFSATKSYPRLMYSAGKIHGHYWLSSAYPEYATGSFTSPPMDYIVYHSYSLQFRDDMVLVSNDPNGYRNKGLPAGKRKRAGGVLTTPEGEDWFQ